MIKITIKSKNMSFESSLGEVKYMIGTNVLMKQRIINAIRKSFNNIKHSDYSLNKDLDTTVYINEQEVDFKKWKLYEINHMINYETEMKMSAKTITHKYFESILMDIEYDEHIKTINELLKDLNLEIKNKMGDVNSSLEIIPEIPELNSHLIVKLLCLNLYGDQEAANTYDITYEDGLLIQLQMIKSICELNKLKNYLVIIDVPLITLKMFEYISKHGLKNLHFLVITNQSINSNINDVINVDQKIIDFGDEISIYNDVFLEIGQHYEMEDLNALIKAYVKKEDTDEVKRLTKLL